MESQRRSSPVQHMDVCVILPAFCGVIVSGEFLKQLGPSERHVATPETGCHTLQKKTVLFQSCWHTVALKACFKQNPTLIHLRHAKSFVFRAARKVPHCQKWDCHALLLFASERAIPRLFSMSILIAGETKNGHAKSTRRLHWFCPRPPDGRSCCPPTGGIDYPADTVPSLHRGNRHRHQAC